MITAIDIGTVPHAATDPRLMSINALTDSGLQIQLNSSKWLDGRELYIHLHSNYRAREELFSKIAYMRNIKLTKATFSSTHVKDHPMAKVRVTPSEMIASLKEQASKLSPEGRAKLVSETMTYITNELFKITEEGDDGV